MTRNGGGEAAQSHARQRRIACKLTPSRDAQAMFEHTAPSAVPAAPKVVFNWPPGKDEVKTKHVKVTFTYSVIPPGRGSTPEPEKGWGRKYRRAPVPNAATKGAGGSPAKASDSAIQSPAAPDGAHGPVAAGAAGGAGGGDQAARQPLHALDRKPALPGATAGIDGAEASGVAAREASGGGAISGAISSEAISEASAGGASEAKSEAKSKLGKQAAKAVTQLDAVIQVLGEVEVFTADDWWNARIEKIVLESRKSARITVSYEQSPGLYAVQPEDEIEFVVRQADGIWAYDRIRYRQPGQAVALAAVAGGTGMEAGGAARAALAPAPAPAPPAPMTSVKRELMMPGMAGVSGGLVEGLQKGITPPAPMSYAKEEAGNEEAVKEPRSTYYPGHPCFWPLFYTRTDGTKLILTKVKEYPHAYKRVRVTHGKEGDVANARNSWMRDLEKEREERRRLGQPSPGLDVDSNKSSPIVASPSNAPPVLSHNRAVAASSLEPGVLLAPQVVRVRRSDKQADGKSPALSHHAPAHHAPAHHARPHDATSHAPEALAGNGAERQDARSSASPAVEPDASDEQAGALRLKVLHALALEDLTKAQLKDKLKAKVPKQMLKELARRVETPGESDRDKCKYKLQPAVWQEVQVDTWNEYSEDDRTFLRIRKTRAQEDAPSTAPSPAQARASHSPMNLDAPTGDKARLEADEAGGRGATVTLPPTVTESSEDFVLVRFSVGDSFAPGDLVVVTPVEPPADEGEFQAKAMEYKSVPITDALCLPSLSPDIYVIVYVFLCDTISMHACMHEKMHVHSLQKMGERVTTCGCCISCPRAPQTCA